MMELTICSQTSEENIIILYMNSSLYLTEMSLQSFSYKIWGTLDLMEQEMRQALEPHKLLTNTASGSKARNTGIILHKNWKTGKLYKHESGGLIGVEITNGNNFVPTG